MGAAIRATRQHIRVGGQGAHGFFVAILKAGDQKLGIQVFGNRQVEHGFKRRFALFSANGHQVFANQVLVFVLADAIDTDVLHTL